MTRKELYALAWTEPMNKLAKEIGVSGSYIARVCDQLNVPRPARGYWAKLAAGKAPEAARLPDARPGEPTSWEPGEPLLVAPSSPRVSTAVVHRRRVRKAPGNTHALLLGAKAHFEKTRPVKDGAYLRPYKKLLVDISTTAACLDDALKLSNALFRALASAGHRVVIAPEGAGLHRADIDLREVTNSKPDSEYPRPWTPWRPTVVYIGTIAIGLAVVEKSELVTLRYIDGDYIREAEYQPMGPRGRAGDRFSWTTTRNLPSGRFRIVAYSPYFRVGWQAHWDAKWRTFTRAGLKAVVAAIEEAAEALVPKLEEAERQAEIERQEREAAFERHKRAEDARRVETSRRESGEQLAEVIEQWSRRMDIERFLAAVQEREETLSPDERSRVEERLRLAREFLGSVDPLDALLAWRTPNERYQSPYSEERCDKGETE